MFCNKSDYHKIEERTRSLLYCGKSYKEFLLIKNEVSVHQRHIRALLTRVFFNSLNNINHEFMWFYFTFKHVTINFRNGPMLKLPRTNYARMGINSVISRAFLLWNRLPQFIINCSSSIELKIKLKQLGNINCSYLIWQNSINNVKIYLWKFRFVFLVIGSSLVFISESCQLFQY